MLWQGMQIYKINRNSCIFINVKDFVFELSSDDDDAEERCKTSIEKAIELDKENPDALQMMANFLLLKEKTQVKG